MRKKRGYSTNLVRAGEPPIPEGALIYTATFPSQLNEKNKVLNEILSILLDRKAIPAELVARFRLCLDEGLVNAVTHGNQSRSDLSVSARVYMGPSAWTLTIDDQGRGFREEDLPDPYDPENLLEESGRGVHLMQTLMDQVTYWRNGATLVMTKSLPDHAEVDGS